MKTYDVVVIGSGVGGTAAAYALKDGEKSVALVEADLWGGTCPNRGCDPKKVLVAGAEAAERNNQLAGKGFAPIHAINWSQLMAFKRTFTAPFPQNYKAGAQKYGIDTYHGRASFENEATLRVGETTLRAGAFVVATGQRPHILNIEGKQHLKTSTDFLDMDEMPPSIAFIGAGYIALELAAIACAAGSKVTVIQHNSRPLQGFDEELVQSLVGALQARGVHFVYNTSVKQVAKEGPTYTLKGENFSHTTHCVICAAGRVPNIEDLQLANAGVAFGKKGIVVNEYLQTATPSIYACGDCIEKSQPKLTPVSVFEGQYVAGRILGAQEDGIQYPPIASVVYASPKLAQVGVTPAQAKQQPQKYTVEEKDLSGWFTYRRINDPVAKIKLVYSGQRLVGATTVSSMADELINLLTIIIHKGISQSEVNSMILASPTVASDLPDLL